MGVLRFALYPPESAEQHPELLCAYITGLDRIPWPTQNCLEGGQLVCRREVSESGVLHVPWQVEARGRLMLHTATLLERDEPYQLVLELARGKWGQVRRHIGDWELAGWQIPAELRSQIRQVQHLFSRTIVLQQEPGRAQSMAQRVLAQAVPIGEELASLFAGNLIRLRHQHYPELRTLVSCRVGRDAEWAMACERFCETFNGLTVYLGWRQVEAEEGQYEWEPFDRLVDWATQRDLILKGGPLIQWSEHALPPWLLQRRPSFKELLDLVADFVETVINRYRGRFRLWEIASRTNCGTALGLDDEQRLRLTARALRAAQACDPGGVCLFTIGLPWSEYVARSDAHYSPLQFADTLLRSELGVGSLGIELIMGYEQVGSFCRDMLDVAEMLDHYSVLGLPLHVSLAVPSASGPAPGAGVSATEQQCTWNGPWSPSVQAQWVEQAVRIATAKPYLQEVEYAQLSDHDGCELAHGGLLDRTGRPKPAFESILQVRKRNGI